MSFTFKNQTGNAASTDTTTATLTGTTVTAGDLIVAWCCWINDGLTPTFADSGGAFTAGSRNTGGAWANANGQYFYKLASDVTGLQTYTFTATGSLGPSFGVYVFTPSSPCVYDNQIATASLGFAGSTSVDSGSLVTSGTDVLICAGLMAENDGSPVTAQAIGGSAATTNAGGFYGGTVTFQEWYLAKTGTNNATATLNASQKWIANAISFKIDAGGATQILHPASWM